MILITFWKYYTKTKFYQESTTCTKYYNVIG